MASSGEVVQIIYDHLDRAKDLAGAAVAALANFEDRTIGLAAIVPFKSNLVPVWIERPTKVLNGFDSVTVE